MARFIQTSRQIYAPIYPRNNDSYQHAITVRWQTCSNRAFSGKGHKQELDLLQKKACFRCIRGTTVNGVRLVYANIYFTADGSRIYGEEEETSNKMIYGGRRSDMSIRYDGYILDKNYSLMELNHIMKEFRKIAVNYCEKAILEQTVYQFLYFYHFREIHSDVRIKELIEKRKI